ncbi:dTMP kinase [Undibacterium oligocarboniphilum]|uniref:Thymidylate kinase n=1 Tax=Undibacterium oligocarboniphilum TaxID=666702 RepID=A0A850QKD0_9BURK|nr:dTMP kinase [Undibacterium oligocarboniphilum]MBC3868646.1 dTMP kinase [Undibacterium oligocarboniphilum]NVO76626.1 dTMP kinase [Undibacterium oligocarboniphilum]
MTFSGKLISFEGIDGAGKSTHIHYVADRLQAALASQNKQVICSREPGGTPLGETLRQILLQQKMHLETEALLMFAVRREHIAQVIEPALKRGDWVISDRFTDASFAYQGGGRHLSLEKLNVLEQWVHPHLQPDLTLLFDVPLEVARARLNATRDLDKFEQEKATFFADTRNEYLRRAAEFPQRFRIIDSTRSIDEIRVQIDVLIDTLLGNGGVSAQ